jgi:hypothetical protein
MSDKQIKVTDRRIFTPDGRVKEEYRHLVEGEEAGVSPRGGEAAGESSEPPPPREEPPTEPSPGGSRPPLEIPGTPPELGAPSFLDLVAMLAQPVALYLGDAQLPDGETAEDLDMARFHIDLLDLLREKTAGNLSQQESAALEELLYQLRMRYVRKRG